MIKSQKLVVFSSSSRDFRTMISCTIEGKTLFLSYLYFKSSINIFVCFSKKKWIHVYIIQRKKVEIARCLSVNFIRLRLIRRIPQFLMELESQFHFIRVFDSKIN